MRFYYSLYILIFLFFSSAQGQQMRSFKFNENSGLSNELVKSISSSKTGYIWLATDGGIFRYNGVSFEYFDIGLPTLFIKHVVERRNGKILASADEGIFEFENNVFEPNAKCILRASKIPMDTSAWYPKHILEDDNNDLWIADNLSIFRVKANGATERYEFPDKDRTAHFQSSFFMFLNDDKKLIVFSKYGYLYHFDENVKKFKEIEYNNKPTEVNGVVKGTENTFLLNTNGTVYEIQLSSNYLTATKKPILENVNASGIATSDNIKFYVCSWTNGVYMLERVRDTYSINQLQTEQYEAFNYIYVRNNQDIWLGSDIGLTLLQFKEFENVYPDTERDYIQDIALAENNYVYFTSGHKIYRTKYGKSLDPLELIEDVTDRFILQILPDKNGLWLADSEGVLTFKSNTGSTQTFSFSDYGTAIFYIYKDSDNNIWLCQDKNENLIKITPQFETFFYSAAEGIMSRPLIVKQSPEGDIYVGGYTMEHYLFKYNKAQDKFDNLSKNLNKFDDINLSVNDIAFGNEGQIYLATQHGLIKHNTKQIEIINQPETQNTAITAITTDKHGNIWMGSAKGLFCLYQNSITLFAEWHGLSSKSIAYRNIVIDPNHKIWVGTTSGVSVNTSQISFEQTPAPVFSKIESNSGILPVTGNLKLYHTNFLKLTFESLLYPGHSIDYQYRILPNDSNWITLKSSNELFIPSLPDNDYQIQFRSKQKGKYYWSEITTLYLEVSPGWYSTWWGILLIILAVGSLVFGIMKTILWKAANDKKALEKTISSRTSEIEYQRMAMQQQRDLANHHLEQISKQNKDITDSILYAKRIQSALLPPDNLIKRSFPQHFILFKPREIVSGDFYWYLNKGNITAFAIGDCTGHGVPGAFMSMLGISLLNELSNHHFNSTAKLKASNILNSLRLNLKNSLRQNDSERISKDGIDLGMVIVDFYNKTVQFSGAYLPMLLVQKDVTHFIKGDRMPIGFYIKEKDDFTNHEFSFEEGDMLYLCSDGFVDQVGGFKGRKYMMTAFREFLIKTSSYPIKEQLTLLEDELTLHMQGYKQMDDITVIGIKLSLSGLRLDAQASNNWEKYKFLVAEDDDTNFMLLQTLLKPTGVHLTHVTNGLEAIMTYNNTPRDFDLILMDLHMPIMHGVSAIKDLRKNGSQVPIVVLTAFTQDELKSNAFAAGANDYLLKPIQFNELIATIGKYLVYK